VDAGLVGEASRSYHSEQNALELHGNGNLGVVAGNAGLENLLPDDRRVVLDVLQRNEPARLSRETQKPLAQGDGQRGFQCIPEAVDLVEAQTPPGPVRQKDGDLLGSGHRGAGPADVVGGLTRRPGAEDLLDHGRHQNGKVAVVLLPLFKEGHLVLEGRRLP